MPAPDPNPEAAKRDAFFANIPEPPANTLVVAAEDHPADAEEGDGDEPAPKAAKPAGKSTAEAVPGAAASSADAPLADRVLAALKAGDLDTLADLTDQDPANFDEKSTKWAARNRKESKLKDEIAKVKADAAAIVEHWEPIDTRVVEFHKTKNYALVKPLIEELLGEDFDSVAMKTFRAVRGEDPRVPVLAKAVAERDAELTDLRTTKQKAADRALREALRDDLPADHQVRKVPEWEDKVAAVLRDSVDADTGEPALSFNQAAQRVVRKVREEYEKYAGVFGEAPAARPARAKAPERAAGTAPATKRALTRDEFFATFK